MIADRKYSHHPSGLSFVHYARFMFSPFVATCTRTANFIAVLAFHKLLPPFAARWFRTIIVRWQKATLHILVGRLLSVAGLYYRRGVSSSLIPPFLPGRLLELYETASDSMFEFFLMSAN